MINQKLSIYIPHVFINITKERICDVFENQVIGNVERIDFIPKMGKDGKEYNTAFIHMKHWYDNDCVGNLQSKITTKTSTARIVYDDPWYWNLYENMNPRSLNEIKLEEKIHTQGNQINILTTEMQKIDAFSQYLEDELNRAHANMFQLRDELGLTLGSQINSLYPPPIQHMNNVSHQQPMQQAPYPNVIESPTTYRSDTIENSVSASITDELHQYRSNHSSTLSVLVPQVGYDM